MNLINAKTRFAWDPGTSRIFDYLTNRHHAPVGTLHDRTGGSWDLPHLAHLLRSEQHIESAHYSRKDPAERVEVPKGIASKDLTHHEVPKEPVVEEQVAEPQAAGEPTPSAEGSDEASLNGAAGAPADPNALVQNQEGGSDEQADNGTA